MKKVVKMVFLAPKVTCNHIFGEEHTGTHRVCIGTCFVILGVLIAQSSALFTGPGFIFHSIHFFLDGSGYLIHGVGAWPIIEEVKKLMT